MDYKDISVIKIISNIWAYHVFKCAYVAAILLRRLMAFSGIKIQELNIASSFINH